LNSGGADPGGPPETGNKRTIESQFVSQRDVFWKRVTVNPRTKGKKKVDYSNPNKVLVSKTPTHCQGLKAKLM
jgi:hypothetical protein